LVAQKFSISHKRQNDEIFPRAEGVYSQFAQSFPRVGDFNAVYHYITCFAFCQEDFSKKFNIFRIFLFSRKITGNITKKASFWGA
jgi:hypothetical protein